MTNSERREFNIQSTIAVALECFEQIGIDAATQAVLAKRVGLSTKTLQRYFKSKDDFLLLCMKNLNEQYDSLIQKRLECVDMDSLLGLERFLAFLSAHNIFLISKTTRCFLGLKCICI